MENKNILSDDSKIILQSIAATLFLVGSLAATLSASWNTPVHPIQAALLIVGFGVVLLSPIWGLVLLYELVRKRDNGKR